MATWAVISGREPDYEYTDGSGSWLAYEFLASDTLAFSQAGDIEYLVVAGGGGGGSQSGGAGGAGAGGFLTGIVAVTATEYLVTVGAGGAGGLSSPGVNGGNSSIGGLVESIGGGAGGDAQGVNGGSGGGNRWGYPSSQAFGVVGQGHDGGVGAGDGSRRSGGGGGAGAPGGDGTVVVGVGGDGLSSSITGTATYYAGGGGGAWSGVGGLGGGGAGSSDVGVSGTLNTGGGGGGGRASGGGDGGSGIVVVRVQANDIVAPTYTDVYSEITASFALNFAVKPLLPTYSTVVVKYSEAFTATLASDITSGEFGAHEFGSGVFGIKTVRQPFVAIAISHDVQATPVIVHVAHTLSVLDYTVEAHAAVTVPIVAAADVTFTNQFGPFVLIEPAEKPRWFNTTMSFGMGVQYELLTDIHAIVPVASTGIMRIVVVQASYAAFAATYEVSVQPTWLWNFIANNVADEWQAQAMPVQAAWTSMPRGGDMWTEQ